MQFSIQLLDYELYDNSHVFYNIKVSDKEQFHSWTIQTDLQQLEEMHQKVQDENPDVPLPPFPKTNIFQRVLTNWFFSKIDKEDILKKKKEIEIYLQQILGPQRPPSIMALKHFLKHGQIKAINPINNFEFGIIQNREQLYKSFKKDKRIAVTTFAKVYVLIKKVQGEDALPKKQLYQYYILKKINFELPESKSITESFILQQISLTKKCNIITNNYPQHFGQIQTIFTQKAKKKSSTQPLIRCWIVQEYFQYTLKKKIEKQRKENKLFPKGFIFDILQSSLKALYQLQQFNFSHRNFKPSNIVFDQNNQIKLIDMQDPSFKLKDQININKNLIDCCFRSPEKINYTGNETLFASKQDAWSLGITILILCNLTQEADLIKLYDNPAFLSNQLEIVKIEYGEYFSNIISRLLCKHQEYRPDFKELINIADDGCVLPLEGNFISQINENVTGDIRIIIKNFLNLKNIVGKIIIFDCEGLQVNFKQVKSQEQELKRILFQANQIHFNFQKSNVNDDFIIEILHLLFKANKKNIFLCLDLKDTPISNKFVDFLSSQLMEQKINVKITIDISKQTIIFYSTNQLLINQGFTNNLIYLKYHNKAKYQTNTLSSEFQFEFD